MLYSVSVPTVCTSSRNNTAALQLGASDSKGWSLTSHLNSHALSVSLSKVFLGFGISFISTA